ncbi:HAD-IA family hydrolase [Castellaniella sp.]|uniref:HAD-IA family hydrolase n=2 Tax=Castellaniella sp. TaxID=1955812 RepID=UPI003C75C8C1
MRIDGIIFDSDGTLVDSEILSARAVSQILQDAGADLSADEALERFRGCQFAVFADALLRDYPVMDADMFIPEFRRRSTALFARELKPMNGALEVVAAITIDKCVASNGPREKIESCLGTTGLLPYFEERVVSAYEVGSWKPDPDLILHAASLMGLSPSRCMLVEDSLAGVQAGLAAGVEVIGYRLSEATQAAVGHRVRVIQELAELHDLIDSPV